MRKQDAIAGLAAHADAIRAFGATSLYLFGSTVRDRAQADSDIDLFVDYDANGRFSLVELVGIKLLLERLLGATIDVTTRDSLDPVLRGDIEASAERVF
jgi:predicted nucleotidyltransferase